MYGYIVLRANAPSLSHPLLGSSLIIMVNIFENFLLPRQMILLLFWTHTNLQFRKLIRHFVSVSGNGAKPWRQDKYDTKSSSRLKATIILFRCLHIYYSISLFHGEYELKLCKGFILALVSFFWTLYVDFWMMYDILWSKYGSLNNYSSCVRPALPPAGYWVG